MKALIFTLLATCSVVVASAQDSVKVKELEHKVQGLEERIARMESRSVSDEAKKMRRVAKQHGELERKTFKAEDIAKAEELYDKASKNLWDTGAKKLLASVVRLYPQLNRAGCAQLYLAQQDTAQNKELLLKDCMRRFDSCFYFDGTQVGPLAMFQLATWYQQTGRKQEAHKLFRRLRRESPEAVGHDGEPLVSKIE